MGEAALKNRNLEEKGREGEKWLRLTEKRETTRETQANLALTDGSGRNLMKYLCHSAAGRFD